MGWFGTGARKREAKRAKKQAEQSYQLSIDMFEWQKEKTRLLEEGKSTKEAKEASIAQYELQRKRTGRASTLKTVEIKGRFGDFKSKYEKEHPLVVPTEPLEPVEIAGSEATPGALLAAMPDKQAISVKHQIMELERKDVHYGQKRRHEEKITRFKGVLEKLLAPQREQFRQDQLAKSEYPGKVKAWETDVAARKKAYTAKTASEFGKISAFKRKNLGPGRVRRKTLYA